MIIHKKLENHVLISIGIWSMAITPTPYLNINARGTTISSSLFPIFLKSPKSFEAFPKIEICLFYPQRQSKHVTRLYLMDFQTISNKIKVVTIKNIVDIN